jgi:hypothetical protein
VLGLLTAGGWLAGTPDGGAAPDGGEAPAKASGTMLRLGPAVRRL